MKDHRTDTACVGRHGGMRWSAVAAALQLFLSPPVSGQDRADPEADEHAAHRSMMAAPAYRVSDAEYVVPDIVLTDERGQPVALRTLLAGDRPIAVNFVYTSCTTICPVMTATMLQLQRELVREPARPFFVSISIDPDYDTAAILSAYAKRFGADWTFLTGDRAAVLGVLQAFSAWRGSKNNHAAVTLFKAAGADRWTRVEGLASASQLAEIWKKNVT